MRFRFSSRAAWTHETITFSQFWLSGAFQWTFISFWALDIDLDDLTLQKASNQLIFVFAKKRAHFSARVWLRLRLRESSPPPPPRRRPQFWFECVWARVYWKGDPVLESTNLPSNGHENAAFCVSFHPVGARSNVGPHNKSDILVVCVHPPRAKRVLNMNLANRFSEHRPCWPTHTCIVVSRDRRFSMLIHQSIDQAFLLPIPSTCIFAFFPNGRCRFAFSPLYCAWFC